MQTTCVVGHFKLYGRKRELSLTDYFLERRVTSQSVCQVARTTGEAKCHGSKLHKEVTEIKVYWFVCLNTFKFAKSKNGLFET